MSQVPEVAGASRAPVLELAQELDASAPTREIPFRTIGLFLPEDSLTINGKPYTFKVDDDRLVKSVKTAEDSMTWGDRKKIHGISIELGQSLPALLTGNNHDRRVLDNENNTLVLSVPREIVSSGTPNKKIAALVDRSLSAQIRRGLLESVGIAKKSRNNRILGAGSLFLFGPAAGASTGAVLEQYSNNQRIGLGMAAFGVVAAGGAFKAIKRASTISERGYSWGRRAAAKDGSLFYPFELGRGGFRQSIVSVRPQRQRRTAEQS